MEGIKYGYVDSSEKNENSYKFIIPTTGKQHKKWIWKTI